MSLSADLFLEARPRSARAACRSITDDIIERALEVIHTGLPNKIIQLTKLCEAAEHDEGSPFHPRWDSTWEAPSPAEDKTGERVGVLQAPKHIIDLWAKLQPLIKEIIALLDVVQLYLLFKTPAAEEGNNTGVEVQQQCIKTLLDARRYVIGCQNYPKLYHTQRAKLASKCLKYPELEDYKRALSARDEEECRDCRYLLSRLRVQCLAVTDGLHKNFNRVSEPKGAAGAGGVVGMY